MRSCHAAQAYAYVLTLAGMALSDAQKAAWAAVLAGTRGGRSLPPALQTALVDFFADPPST